MKSPIINIVIDIIRLLANSLTMLPIGEEIYYYKWWNMAMVAEKGLEIRSKSIPPAWWLLVVGRVQGQGVACFLIARDLFI